jgi:uridine kinase
MLPAERDAVNFDHPQALEFELLGAHLSQLLNGSAVDVPLYDFATHTRQTKSLRLSPRPVVLIEGILIFSQQRIFEQLNYSFFVDTCQDVRLERRIQRDVAERGRTPESVRAQFFATVAPMHDLFVEPSKAKAKVVISGESPFEDTIQQLAQELAQKA